MYYFMNKDNWTKITVDAEESVLDELAQVLIEAGSESGVEVISGSEGAHVVGYFLNKAIDDLLGFEEKIKAMERATSLRIPFRVEAVDPEDWKESYKQFFEPITVLDTLMIVPEWEVDNIDFGDKKTVILTPGMAFGTGHHETTLGVLQCMVPMCKNSPPKSMLDVGCGSGILSIAGKLLGIERVVGLDIDPGAMIVAEENIEKNDLKGKIGLFYNTLSELTDTYHLVVANIISETLKSLREEIRDRIMPGGKLILSGILEEQEYGVKRIYSAHATVRFVSRHQIGEWVTLIFEKLELPHKYSCVGCDFCQFCSDSRCDICRLRGLNRACDEKCR